MKNKTYKSKELLAMDSVSVYKLILEGKISTFPKGYWKKEDRMFQAALCTRYLIEEVLKWSEKDVKTKLNKYAFIDNHLGTMSSNLFNKSTFKALKNAYGDKYKVWQLSNVPQKYWSDKDKSIEPIKWLFEEELKWNIEDVKSKLCKKTFVDNGLGGMLKTLFNNSPFLAYDYVYPERIKKWELKDKPNDYWNLDTANEAIEWLVENKLKLDRSNMKDNIRLQDFKDNNLYGMLERLFNGSMKRALNYVYPDIFII